MSTDQPSPLEFSDFALSKPVMKALDDVGYETPTPIQARTIPLVLAGRDVVGQAQTGTGKTAAFALPLLTRIDLKNLVPQVLVLTPTRELAIQVAEAFHRYAAHMKGFHVLPVYGGQDIGGQFRQLKRGVHVVVGTPGRVMDHLRRGTLNLDGLTCLVLDEADEMLRMGFIDDVEWILEQTPPERQVTLFSATMPPPIRRIARKHLRDPEEIMIEMRTTTADTIHQRYWMVSGLHKLDALTRILEAERFDGMLVFVRTKTATAEVSEKLEARGYACAPLNGDIPQNKRERTVELFKSGKIDILVATDVAARGLDVERISHVINYDIPHDTEAYVHRIGRTGRAGRSGEAILFITPRERRMLTSIERATRQKIDILELPSTESINDIRIARFKQRITDTLEAGDMDFYVNLLEKYREEQDVPALDIAAALAKLMQGDTPLLLKSEPRHARERIDERPSWQKASKTYPSRAAARSDAPKATTYPSKAAVPRHDVTPKVIAPKSEAPKAIVSKPEVAPRSIGPKSDAPRAIVSRTIAPRISAHKTPVPGATAKASSAPEPGMERYRIEVGQEHSVMPGNIVGAIANEVGLESRYIGHIDIHEDYSLIDLPEGMPVELFRQLKKVWVAGQQLKISRFDKPAKRVSARHSASMDDDDRPASPARKEKPLFAKKTARGATDKPSFAKKRTPAAAKKKKMPFDKKIGKAKVKATRKKA